MKWENVQGEDSVTSCTSNQSRANFADSCTAGVDASAGQGQGHHLQGAAVHEAENEVADASVLAAGNVVEVDDLEAGNDRDDTETNNLTISYCLALCFYKDIEIHLCSCADHV